MIGLNTIIRCVDHNVSAVVPVDIAVFRKTTRIASLISKIFASSITERIVLHGGAALAMMSNESFPDKFKIVNDLDFKVSIRHKQAMHETTKFLQMMKDPTLIIDGVEVTLDIIVPFVDSEENGYQAMKFNITIDGEDTTEVDLSFKGVSRCDVSGNYATITMGGKFPVLEITQKSLESLVCAIERRPQRIDVNMVLSSLKEKLQVSLVRVEKAAKKGYTIEGISLVEGLPVLTEEGCYHCPVCMDLDISGIIVQFECSHQMCGACLLKVASQKDCYGDVSSSCSLCRAKIEPSFIDSQDDSTYSGNTIGETKDSLETVFPGVIIL